MLKMMDKTNIDFIGPRYYCMAGSLILIVLGLVAFFARGRTMYNIDFTGGTLVTIRLNEDDPSVKSLSESQRASSSAQKAERPARRDRREPQGRPRTRRSTRFNIRTTEQERRAGQGRRSSRRSGRRLATGRDDRRRRASRSPAPPPRPSRQGAAAA